MRLPGAALLIVIGLLLLWLATSGNLDRLGVAWSGLTAPTDDTATGVAAACDPSSGICDPSKYATESMMHALTPGVSVVNPGGMI